MASLTCLTFSGGLPESTRKALPRRKHESFMSSQREVDFSEISQAAVPGDRQFVFVFLLETTIESAKKLLMSSLFRSPCARATQGLSACGIWGRAARGRLAP